MNISQCRYIGRMENKFDKIGIVPGEVDPNSGGGFYRSSLAKSYWPKTTTAASRPTALFPPGAPTSTN